MKIPIAGQTMKDLRDTLVSLQILDERTNAGGSYRVHDYCKQLLDEIARLRDLEVVVCKTKWHDHGPPAEMRLDGEPPAQLELLTLTQMMGKPNG